MAAMDRAIDPYLGGYGVKMERRKPEVYGLTNNFPGASTVSEPLKAVPKPPGQLPSQPISTPPPGRAKTSIRAIAQRLKNTPYVFKDSVVESVKAAKEAVMDEEQGMKVEIDSQGIRPSSISVNHDFEGRPHVAINGVPSMETPAVNAAVRSLDGKMKDMGFDEVSRSGMIEDTLKRLIINRAAGQDIATASTRALTDTITASLQRAAATGGPTTTKTEDGVGIGTVIAALALPAIPHIVSGISRAATRGQNAIQPKIEAMAQEYGLMEKPKPIPRPKKKIVSQPLTVRHPAPLKKLGNKLLGAIGKVGYALKWPFVDTETTEAVTRELPNTIPADVPADTTIPETPDLASLLSNPVSMPNLINNDP